MNQLEILFDNVSALLAARSFKPDHNQLAITCVLSHLLHNESIPSILSVQNRLNSVRFPYAKPHCNL